MYKLRTRIIVSNIVLSLAIVATVSLFVNAMFDKVFRNYIISNQSQKNRDIIHLITENYDSKNSSWDYRDLEQIGMTALGNGLIISVKDNAGNILWNAWSHNEGKCVELLQKIAENMEEIYSDFKGGYVAENIEINANGIYAGSLYIGSYGPFYYEDNELHFIKSFNLIVIIASIFSFIIAIIFGLFNSRTFSMPIINVICAANQIMKGDYSERILIKSKTIEYNELICTINNLAKTLEKLDNTRKRFTGDIAHEFRTPLFNLQCHVEAMLDGVWEADAKRLQSCHDEIMRLNRMTEDIRKLSSFESEDLTLYKQTFRLNDLISSVVSSFEVEFVKKDIKLIFEGDYIGDIYADRDKIGQIFVNIISNAIRFSSNGTDINIKTEQSGKMISIRIKDAGIGISSEDLPFIFERFYRIDKSRATATGGTGIGLAIAKALTLAHKGEISVISELGKGTAFTIMLPISNFNSHG